MTTPITPEPAMSVLVIKPENYGDRMVEETIAYAAKPGETVAELAHRLLHEPTPHYDPRPRARFDARIEIRLAHPARSAS